MKTTFQILTILLSMHSSFLFANISNDGNEKKDVKKVTISICFNNSISVAPLAADLRAGSGLTANPEILIANLVPVTPTEADFEENDYAAKLDISTLTISIPTVLDFEETENTTQNVLFAIAPAELPEADLTE